MKSRTVVPGRAEGASPEPITTFLSMTALTVVMDSGPAGYARVPE
jgi:hypothetical protein